MTLHGFLLLNVRLGPGQDLTHPHDVMLQQVFVLGVRDLQPTDECEYRDIILAIGNLGKLALEVVDVGWRLSPKVRRSQCLQ